jgi:hypothetical protein
MSWENNIYEPEVKPSRPKKGMDPMVALALTSKRWEKNQPSERAGFSNLPPELRTKIYEYLEKPAPPVLKGRRRPGTLFREPRNFLTRRRLMKEIPEKAASFNKRRGIEMVEKIRRQVSQEIAAEQAQRLAEQQQQRRGAKSPSPGRSNSSAERRRATAKSRARRGARYNVRPYALPKTRSKKASKATRKLQAIARKQNSKA